MKCIILSISAALLLTGTKIVGTTSDTDNKYQDFEIITGDTPIYKHGKNLELNKTEDTKYENSTNQELLELNLTTEVQSPKSKDAEQQTDKLIVLHNEESGEARNGCFTGFFTALFKKLFGK